MKCKPRKNVSMERERHTLKTPRQARLSNKNVSISMVC
jgi:hypothetical protein